VKRVKRGLCFTFGRHYLRDRQFITAGPGSVHLAARQLFSIAHIR
jgi:hypothetical protein